MWVLTVNIAPNDLLILTGKLQIIEIYLLNLFICKKQSHNFKN